MNEKIEIKRQLKYLENWLVEHQRYKIIGSLDSKFSFDLDDLQKFYDYITNLQNQLQQKENIIKEIKEYITSYESIETIQQFDHNKNNKDLDYSTMDEMTRRYMIVHDKVLEILDKVDKE